MDGKTPSGDSRPPVADLLHILEHTKGLWEEARNRRVFLTGGTGFFGRWLLESLLFANDAYRLNARIDILTRRPDAFRERVPRCANHPSVRLVPGDVRHFDFPEQAYPLIIHAAAESSTPGSGADPEELRATIVEGTRRMLEFSIRSGAERFLFVSSGAVYGPQPPGELLLPEEYPSPPLESKMLTPYGAGKCEAERLCREVAAKSSICVSIARGFAFIGPFMPLTSHFAVSNFLRDVLLGQPVVVKGDGTPFRSYMYGADLAIWLWTILLKGRTGHAYNVGSENSISIKELAETVVRLGCPGIPVIVEQQPREGTRSSRYVPSTEKAWRELGLHSWIELPDAINRTLRWHRTENTALKGDLE